MPRAVRRPAAPLVGLLIRQHGRRDDAMIEPPARAVQIQEPEEPRPRLTIVRIASASGRPSRDGRDVRHGPASRTSGLSTSGSRRSRPGAPRPSEDSRARGEDARSTTARLVTAPERSAHVARHDACRDIGLAGLPGADSGTPPLDETSRCRHASVGWRPDARRRPARNVARERVFAKTSTSSVTLTITSRDRTSPERPRRRTADHQLVVTADHARPQLVSRPRPERGDHRLEDHSLEGSAAPSWPVISSGRHDSRMRWRCSGYWPSLPP
jgi:hypothetical protein